MNLPAPQYGINPVRNASYSSSDRDPVTSQSPTPSQDTRDRHGSGLGQIPEDEKVSQFDKYKHEEIDDKPPRRPSYSLTRRDFENDEEHRRYKARKRWRKVKILMKAMYKFSRRETYHHVDSSGSVFWKIKLLYALPQFSLISLTMLINIQVIVFYNEIGVSLAFLSFFQIFARSFDVLTDPMMAHISDNLTRTKIGRRLPWMCLGAPFYAVSFFILMSPPTSTASTTASGYNMPATYWFGASYMLFYLCDTVANIPLLALGPELSDNSDHRTSLFMWVKLFEGIGTIVGGGSPVIFLSLGMSKKASFQLLAAIFGSWYVISMALLIRTVKEREQSLSQQATPFVASISRSFRNIAFRPLAIAWVLDFCALAMLVAVLPFFVRYYVQAGDDSDTVLSVGIVGLFLCGFSSIPVWKVVSGRGDQWYKFGRRNAWLFYNLLMCVTNFGFLLIGPHQPLLLIIFLCLNGAPVGGQFLIMSMVSDVIDYDEFLNFSRNEGAFTVFSQFVPKLVAIPAQSFPLIVMFMLGYKNPEIQIDPETGEDVTIFHEQNASVKGFLRVMFAVMPTVISCISFIIKQQYFPIKNHQIVVDISNGITKHMQGLPAIDPITKQEVMIEEYKGGEQEIVDLLDHFTYTQIIWLLEPNTILKKHNKDKDRHKRRMSFQAVSNVLDVKDFLTKLQTRGSMDSKTRGSIEVRNNAIAPDINKSKRAPSEITSSSVRVVSDPDTNIIETSYFKSMGKTKGIARIQRQMLFWILFGIIFLVMSGVGVSVTLRLLHNINYAFIPALFCLCIGTSTVFIGFHVLKLKAAMKLQQYIGGDLETKVDLDDLLKRVLYPKIKGQRGGGFVWSDVERTQIDVLAGGDDETHRSKPKKLKKFQKLFQLRNRNKMNKDYNKPFKGDYNDKKHQNKDKQNENEIEEEKSPVETVISLSDTPNQLSD